MPTQNSYLKYAFLLAFASSFLQAMVYDNRFVPLLKRPRLDLDRTTSYFSTYFLAASAHSSIDEHQKEIGLPEIQGGFELNRLANAIQAIGKPNPLRSDLRLGKFPYIFDGSMQMQGVELDYQQQVLNWLSFGVSMAFMRVNTYYQFRLDLSETRMILGAADLFELEEMRRRALCEVGIDGGNAAHLGFGDVDAYIRFGNIWDYTLKFRRIDAGISLGILIPSAARRDIFKLSSIPLGGDGRWGGYIAADALVELREDMKVGMYAGLLKRQETRRQERVALQDEGPLFGVVVGNATVNPGWTLVLAPSFILEHLREGLGFCIQYNLIWHSRDDWEGVSCRALTNCNTGELLPYNRARMEGLSGWTAEYVTCEVFYDFGRVKLVRNLDPVLSIQWDIPVQFFSAQRVFKTNRVSVGLTFAF